jgi:hypothetical protein
LKQDLLALAHSLGDEPLGDEIPGDEQLAGEPLNLESSNGDAPSDHEGESIIIRDKHVQRRL